MCDVLLRLKHPPFIPCVLCCYAMNLFDLSLVYCVAMRKTSATYPMCFSILHVISHVSHGNCTSFITTYFVAMQKLFRPFTAMQIFALYPACIVLLFMHGQCNIFCSLIGPQVQEGNVLYNDPKTMGRGAISHGPSSLPSHIRQDEPAVKHKRK
jgi:hypothetical protein